VAYGTVVAVKAASRRPSVIATKTIAALGSAAFASTWTLAGDPWGAGATPVAGAGETVSAGTPGAFPLPPGPAGGQARYVVRARARTGVQAGGVPGQLLVYDRLVQTSGLAWNTTAPQPVNSVALPRFTSGDGVWLALENYAAATAGVTPSFQIGYTNEQGVAGRTTVATTMPFAGLLDAAIPALAAGDYGVRSVESVTLATAAATAGNFGITLLKPVLWLQLSDEGDNRGIDWTKDWRFTALAAVDPNACLAVLTKSYVASTRLPLLDLLFGDA
jgi:hypothetical protein